MNYKTIFSNFVTLAFGEISSKAFGFLLAERICCSFHIFRDGILVMDACTTSVITAIESKVLRIV